MISLMRTILEWAVRTRAIKSNPFHGVQKLVTQKKDRSVTAEEQSLSVEVGRLLGGPQYRVAMSLETACLCVRRSVEVRAMTRDQTYVTAAVA